MKPVRGPLQHVRGLRARLAGMAAVIGQTRDGVQDVSAALAIQGAEIQRLSSLVDDLEAQMRDEQAYGAARDSLTQNMLRVVFAEERAMRERLWHERSDAEYEVAYVEPEPLVSVVIATYDNFGLMGERALPSILRQSYQNFEVVIVGDRAPPEAADTVARFNDDRLRYYNLNRRGPYPRDPTAFRNVAGTPAYNEGVHHARGRWIAPLGDDDAFRANHIEVLLELARRERLEAAYGKYLTHFRDGRPTELVGEFPPVQGFFGLQNLLYHAHLSFFELELGDEIFSLAGDWSFAERMLRCGVRFGMVDDIVTDYYPSWSWTPREVS